jgi:hypothetical protein
MNQDVDSAEALSNSSNYLIDSVCRADIGLDEAIARSITLHRPSGCHQLAASSGESINNGCADTASSTGY